MTDILLKAREDMKEGLTIDEVCRKYNISFSELFNGLNVAPTYSNQKEVEEGIIFYKKRYIITKIVDGELKYYGSFLDLKEAKQVYNELEARNWIVSDNEVFGDTYLAHRNNTWTIQKTINDKPVYFGVYSSRYDARRVRAELIKCNWDKSKLTKICDKLNIKRRK
jgi:hypothetical protein